MEEKNKDNKQRQLQLERDRGVTFGHRNKDPCMNVN
jgi:hypothetical protein